MKSIKNGIVLFIIYIFLSGYILPPWFIIKESASIRSKFNIKRFSFNTILTYTESETTETCNADFEGIRDAKILNIKLTCGNSVSELKFKDYRLISQNIKSSGKFFTKLLLMLIENEDLILPLPISSERLKNRICQIADNCSNVRYKRLGGTVNYQFYSKDSGNYYMIDKDNMLPSALFIKEKNLYIETKKYYAFSTNIKFPSVIEIKNDNRHIVMNIEDLDIE